MTWKKRQEHVMDGDICEPSEWRINNNEFASEFNGFLDSDNINDEALTCDQVKRDTFTRVLINQEFMHYDYLFSHQRSGYTSQPDYQVHAWDRDVYISGSEFGGVVNENMMIQIQHSLDIGGSIWSNILDGHGPPPTSWRSFYNSGIIANKHLPMVSVFTRADLEDPDRECRLPYFKFTTEGDSLLIIDLCGTVQQHTAFTLNNATDACNSMIYHQEGIVTSEVVAGGEGERCQVNSLGYPYRLKKTNKLPEKSALILCSTWRVMVDGNVVCTSGMIGPELEAQPIYLTGAIPVTSGDHTVEVQGKTCWYCPSTGKEVPSSAIDAHVDWEEGWEDATTAAMGSIFREGVIFNVREKIRKDISLRQPNLVVQIRSR